jgi:2-polyprenyl-3-methyl-5-hydroxy-6-metoxy-1,4-benzoquinol methylase
MRMENESLLSTGSPPAGEKEIDFEKYEKRGAYHWEHYFSRHPVRRNIYTKARYDIFLRLLGDIKGKRILDLGCGDGVLTYLLARGGAAAFGVDASLDGVRLADGCVRERSVKTRFHVSSCYDLPFGSDVFDGIICTDVIEHLREPARLLGEAARVLKKDGTFILSTNVRLTERPMDHMHVEEFFPEAFKRMVQDKFRVERFLLTHPVSYFELYHFQNKWTLKKPIFRILFNCIEMVSGRNVFFQSAGWRLFAQQTAVLRRVA